MDELDHIANLELEQAPATYPPSLHREREQWREWVTGLANAVQGRLQKLSVKVDKGADRLDAIEAAGVLMIQLTVVATVADLPSNAPPRQWFRVSTGTAAERTAVYIGNGNNQPLTKLVPAAL